MTKTLADRRKINDEIKMNLNVLLLKVEGVVDLDDYFMLMALRIAFADAIEEVLCPEDFDPDQHRILDELVSHLSQA